MKYNNLIEAKLLKRYKRFLADVELLGGEQITVHCPNTGKMTGCAEAGSRVWLSRSDNPKRKYAYTWELVEVRSGVLAAVHSAKANGLVIEALQNDLIKELAGFDELQKERRFGEENSRADVWLRYADQSCYVEVKSVTLDMGKGVGMFPDTVSARGAKHLRELIRVKRQGHRAILLFCVQHEGIREVSPAEHIDGVYAQTLKEALVAGVEVLVYRAKISLQEIYLNQSLPFCIG